MFGIFGQWWVVVAAASERVSPMTLAAISEADRGEGGGGGGGGGGDLFSYFLCPPFYRWHGKGPFSVHGQKEGGGGGGGFYPDSLIRIWSIQKSRIGAATSYFFRILFHGHVSLGRGQKINCCGREKSRIYYSNKPAPLTGISFPKEPGSRKSLNSNIEGGGGGKSWERMPPANLAWGGGGGGIKISIPLRHTLIPKKKWERRRKKSSYSYILYSKLDNGSLLSPIYPSLALGIILIIWCFIRFYSI